MHRWRNVRTLAVATLAAFGVMCPLLAQAPETARTAAPDAALSPRNASYSIDVHLDPATHRLTGSEIITWRNITASSTSELQFHLYWNAWKDERSTWMRERALSRPLRLADRDRSRMSVTSVKVSSSGTVRDLTSAIAFIAPDDGNVDDRTVMRVPLEQAVAPGGSLTIEVAWEAVVPRPVARTGVIGSFYFLGQWFPKLGVLQDGGWNCHQFHASTEFFSDYGIYDVRMTVPTGWMVGATGLEQERQDQGDGTTLHRYYQDDVHDFAWTTSPDFIERTARFDEPGLPPVDLRLLLQPEHAAQADRHFAAAITVLRHYGQWFGPYPYGHLTIIDPAYRSEADGMEYPTLITAGTRWLIPSAVTVNTPEEVVAHEAGHQFWYGMVGTNEFEDAWMDEGINTYATARAMAEDYPLTFHEERYFGGFIPWAFTDVPLRRETFWNRLAGYRRDAKSDPASMPAYRFYPPTGGSITYNKTALWLNTLERWIGWPDVQRILSTVFVRFQFRHPTPRDFFDTAREVSGRDLTSFFDQVYRSSDVFDYGVDKLLSEPSGDGFLTTVVVRRYGEALFPIDVRVTFDNGEQVTEHWDGKERWHEYTYVKPSRAVAAQADPERTLLLDVDYTNNSRTLNPRAKDAAAKWSSKWMVWLEDALLSWGFLI